MEAADLAATTAALRESWRGFLTARSPLSTVRAHMEMPSGFDREFFTRCASDMEVLGIGVPEELGGSGAAPVLLAAVFGELGRSLACGPFLSTALATTVLACGDETLPDVVTDIVGGRVIAALVASLPADTGLPCRIEVKRSSAARSITGTCRFVIDAGSADLFVVIADTPSDAGIYVVDAAAPGVDVTPVKAMDLTRRVGHVVFDNASARTVREGPMRAALDVAADTAALLFAADAVGGAERVVEMSIDYAKTRTQFARPIGSFQAIKHKCADLLLELELARSLLEIAIAAYGDPNRRSAFASAAKAFCTETYVRAAKDCIQIHGGIGFTWEHPAHLYLKRAKGSQLLMGSPHWHRARAAELLRLPAS